MNCEACVVAVRDALEAVTGVEVFEVRLGEADVTFDPSVTSKAKLFDAVRAAGGFEVSSFSAQ